MPARRTFDQLYDKSQGLINQCWIWQGSINYKGYAVHGGRGAYRTVYELEIGPIPNGHDVDHRCGNRLCVNPLHLVAMSHRENILRSNNHVARYVTRTHCRHGHELISMPGNRRRSCLECPRAAKKAYKMRMRGAR